MQYSIQGLNCEDPDRKDLLMDIGTENLAISRSWMPGADASQTIQIRSSGRRGRPLIAIAGGGG